MTMAAIDSVSSAFQTCSDGRVTNDYWVDSHNEMGNQSLGSVNARADQYWRKENMDVRPGGTTYSSQSQPITGKKAPYHNGMNSILFHQATAPAAFSPSYQESEAMYNDFSVYGMPECRPPPQQCRTETGELGPLSMNGYSHVGPENQYESSPTAQSGGNNGVSEDDDLDEDESIDDESAGQDFTQVKLRWKSYQEARNYRTAINRRFSPDPSIPQSDEERQKIVRGFIMAMKHVNDDDDAQNTSRPFKASKYNDEVLEMCAWNLLEMTIQRHTTGPLRTSWHDKAKGSKPYTTFMERVDAITDAMMKIKMIVKHVLDTPYVYTFIDDPEGCKKRVETNKCLNKKKAYVMSAGKQYLQQQLKTPGNITPEDSSNNNSARQPSARARAKQRTVSLSNTTHTNQPQQMQSATLGSPFSTPNHHPSKREDSYAGMGLPMRNPHPSRFDLSPGNLYSSSLPDGLIFSPSQHGGTPGSSIPRSYVDFSNDMYNTLPINIAMSDRSTPLSSTHGLQTPMTQMHGTSMGYQSLSQSGGSTVSPSSLVINGGSGGSAPQQQCANMPYMYGHRNVSTPPQSSPRKRGFDLSGTSRGIEHPSQRRAI